MAIIPEESILAGEGDAVEEAEAAELSGGEGEGFSAQDLASLAAAGVTEKELAACVSVLGRLHRARENVDWSGKGFREFRKAIALHSKEAFSHVPQKNAVDKAERAKHERIAKRQRKQRQLDADKKWKENAQLRASRLDKLQALEGGAGEHDTGGGPLLCLEGPGDVMQTAEQGVVVVPAQQPTRIPDGPARDGEGSCLAAQEGDDENASVQYCRQQACYICKARFGERHHFYSHLCPLCADLNFMKRHQQHDLHGRVCLVTGARVKIGFETALKLLRMGARVIATTRFPQDAAQRYRAQADADDWLERLEVRGVDFRFLGAVESFCEDLLAREAWLDVLVNNACQTIRRPASYYRHLVEAEAAAAAALGDAAPSSTAALTGASTDAVASSLSVASSCVEDAVHESAALSQLAVLPEDRMTGEEAALAMPEGQRDVHGQQLDLRATNSWLLKLGQVNTSETVEVFCINALTPFVLNGRLRPLFERSPHPDRYIVNVSAMEGKFYRYKQPTHPHTNMAKAALNMMTRTSADDYARTSGIYMNSVDTGWINDENPLPTAQRIAASHGFQTPIDEIDAAARILDPVLTGMKVVGAGSSNEGAGSRQRQRKGGGAGGGGGGEADDEPMWGHFLKDYVLTEW